MREGYRSVSYLIHREVLPGWGGRAGRLLVQVQIDGHEGSGQHPRGVGYPVARERGEGGVQVFHCRVHAGW